MVAHGYRLPLGEAKSAALLAVQVDLNDSESRCSRQEEGRAGEKERQKKRKERHELKHKDTWDYQDCSVGNMLADTLAILNPSLSPKQWK